MSAPCFLLQCHLFLPPTQATSPTVDIDIVAPGNRSIAMVHYWVRHAKCTWSSLCFKCQFYKRGEGRSLLFRHCILLAPCSVDDWRQQYHEELAKSCVLTSILCKIMSLLCNIAISNGYYPTLATRTLNCIETKPNQLLGAVC